MLASKTFWLSFAAVIVMTISAQDVPRRDAVKKAPELKQAEQKKVLKKQSSVRHSLDSLRTETKKDTIK
jgi:hypothetical protein